VFVTAAGPNAGTLTEMTVGFVRKAPSGLTLAYVRWAGRDARGVRVRGWKLD
jgi:hypothetical protein